MKTFTTYLSAPIETLRNYRLRDLPRDALAGLTVSVVDLPQSMAFAVIAGVSPIYGIYTAIIQSIIGGLFTSSRFLSNGPTNTQSLLVAAICTRLAEQGTTYYLQLVIAMTLLKGLIQLGFAAARMGTLVRYVSSSVMIGFTAGAGVLIVAGQLPNFLGIDVSRSPGDWPGLVGVVQRLWPQLGAVNFYAVGLGVVSLIVLLILRRMSRLTPGPLVVVAGAAAVVWGMQWEALGVRTVGELPTGVAALPQCVLPQFDLPLIEQLFGGALALALLGMLESVSIAKSIAIRTHDRIDANQEFFAQGLSNLVGSFFQCMPGSGSFSRSALQYDAGAKTRLCSIVTAISNTFIFLLLAGPARYIPYPSLAAILFVIGAMLIDWRSILRITRTSRSDAVVCLGTFVLVLVMPLTYAIYMGIFLNLALYLRHAGRLHMDEMVRTPGGPFLERPLRDRGGNRPVMFLQVEGDLFFAVADELGDRLTRLTAKPDLRVVILRLKRTHWIDTTVLQTLEMFADQMQSANRHVILCGVRSELMHTFQQYGIVTKFGRENVFETSVGVFSSAKLALARARKLIGRSIDTEGFELLEETETDRS